LTRLTRGLDSRHYPDAAAVGTRLALIGKTRRIAAYLRGTTGTGTDTGKPTLTWHFDRETIDDEAATDGWYALLTNLDPIEADAAQVLLHRTVERRYSTFEGPLAVAAIYLKNNRRITAMITVVCLALLIFSFDRTRGQSRSTRTRPDYCRRSLRRPARRSDYPADLPSHRRYKTPPHDQRQTTHHPSTRTLHLESSACSTSIHWNGADDRRRAESRGSRTSACGWLSAWAGGGSGGSAYWRWW